MTEAQIYYARDDRVFKSPVKNRVPGGTNVTVGFPVCTASDYVEAEDIAEMLVAAESHEALVKALDWAMARIIKKAPHHAIEGDSELYSFAVAHSLLAKLKSAGPASCVTSAHGQPGDQRS